MAEALSITSTNKTERYQELLPQIKSLIADETDQIAVMANVCAALKFGMNFFWVGFYLVKDQELVLGPFQGPVACTRIRKGKGVCGSAWEKKLTLIVEDVEKFPGHIACSAASKSEIVIPIFDAFNHVVAVLDVDSDQLKAFDHTDEIFLKKLLSYISI